MKINILLIIIINILIVLLIILNVLSYVLYHRSLMASIVELYLKIFIKRYSDLEIISLLNKMEKEEEKRYILPKLLFLKNKVKDLNYKNMQMLIFNKEKKSDCVIIYLHGGAYFRNPRYHHMKFLKKLSRKTNFPIYVPIYPKVPKHNVLESYNLLTELYVDISKRYKTIYMIGDSSGGGLALGLCEHFKDLNIEQPRELILLSPWVDISLNNPQIKDYVKKDPLVNKNEIKILGKYWAGNLEFDNYKVSPIYGNMLGLKSVNIFVGTREILYCDNILLYMILKDSNVDVKCYIGKMMNHVYPIYPIPEAKKAFKKILEILEIK